MYFCLVLVEHMPYSCSTVTLHLRSHFLEFVEIIISLQHHRDNAKPVDFCDFPYFSSLHRVTVHWVSDTSHESSLQFFVTAFWLRDDDNHDQ